MQLQEMISFIKNNSHEQLSAYYGELKESIRDTKEKSDRLYFWMIIIGVLYYLYRTSAISGLEFSIIKLDNIRLVGLLTAPVFSAMMLFNTLLNAKLDELRHFSKLIAFKLYNHGQVSLFDIATSRQPHTSRLTQPMSIGLELLKESPAHKTDLLDLILLSPAALIGLTPLAFMAYTNIKLIQENNGTSLGLVVIAVTTYINLFAVYRFWRKIFGDIKRSEQPGNNALIYLDEFNSFSEKK
ncbi:hypothetical protein ACS5PU_16535 [Pedobacter sp. GSP4]|uniref:hypothetical protein n=1 Tax=Pedobacter sp. GSP4 TaxID=3453716 RepID=UPI003EEDB5FF